MPARMGPAVAAGESSLAILTELGYSEREAEALVADGVVGVTPPAGSKDTSQ
jgi:crotonobetainyl-CoA:carnitine CoA-transferase CaiB-like acyl-CoA transferase